MKTSYPGSDAANSANDVLTNMTNANTAITSPEKTYTVNKSEEHYFVIIADEKNTDVKSLEKDIADFNSTYYGLENLQQQSIIWEDTQKAIVIKNFQKENTVMGYYMAFKTKILSKYPTVGTNYFPISVTNYITFYKNKNIAQYYDFFMKEYSK